MKNVFVASIFAFCLMACSEDKPEDPLAKFKPTDAEISKMSAGKAANLIGSYRRLSKGDKAKVKIYMDKVRKKLAQMPESERRMTHENKHSKGMK